MRPEKLWVVVVVIGFAALAKRGVAGSPLEQALGRLDLNETTELNEAYGSIEDDAVSAVQSKYRQLRSLTRHEAEHADATYVVAYHPLEIAAVNAVRHEFGPLYVDPYEAASEPAVWQRASSEQHPWSGFWYPLRGNQLFEGDAAPLAKADAYLLASGQEAHVAAWERTRHDTTPFDAWEGLCGAWALASFLTPEPLAPRTVGDVTLSISDQKALLTKLHEELPSRRLGVRYLGDVTTDGTIQDLRPEAFHRVFTSLLNDGKAFVIDEDPGPEVWQRPVYQAQWMFAVDPEVEHALRVTARVLSVNPRNVESDTPTTIDDLRSTTYEYRLFYDPERPLHGKYPVIAGEWLGDSLRHHPDFVILPAAGATRRSANPELNSHVSLMDELLGLIMSQKAR